MKLSHIIRAQGLNPEKYILPKATKVEHVKGVANMVPVDLAVACWRAIIFSMEGEEPPGGSCHAAIRMEHTTLASMESASSSNDSRKLCDAAFCSLRAIKKREDVWRCGRHDNLFLQPTEKVRGRGGEEETLCFVCRSSVWWCEDTARERH